MGVLNVTPDSFSDGGQFNLPATAVAQARALAVAGVDILDVGGESTRPGALEVSEAEELERVIPVIRALRTHLDLPISVDTTKAAVAQAALEAGADLINDISAGRFEPEILKVAARFEAPVLLMHMLGRPRTMQQQPSYTNLIGEIYSFLEERLAAAVAAGIPRSQVAVDPGIGFGKTLEHNLEILRRLTEFRPLGVPLLIGTSRKSFIGKILNQPNPQERIWGNAATVTSAIMGGADIVRVHDGEAMVQVCRMSDAIWRF
ncbi:dihydropteroate synthase [Leptolyngbya sp. FACHB-261]|nr:dihydropteroate synthase [Leptolyngbya sp. FACHB-261]